MKYACCFIPKPLCFVHLGRYGDEMIIMPGLKKLYDDTGEKPIVVITKEFSSIFSGVSYVEPDIVDLVWWRDGDLAVKYAEEKYGHAILPKWWDFNAPSPAPKPGDKEVLLKINGREIVIGNSDWQSYQLAQWAACGWTPQEMMEWPLVFDRRSIPREAQLRSQWFRTKKPKLLVAIGSGSTSPFPAVPEVMNVIFKFQREFEIVDVSKVHATRIYDLLGLFDYATGLIASDSAPAHLAAASRVPTFWFINNGGQGSIPTGNCIASVRYADVMPNLRKLHDTIDHWKNHADPLLHATHAERPVDRPTFAGGGGNLAAALLA